MTYRNASTAIMAVLSVLTLLTSSLPIEATGPDAPFISPSPSAAPFEHRSLADTGANIWSYRGREITRDHRPTLEMLSTTDPAGNGHVEAISASVIAPLSGRLSSARHAAASRTADLLLTGTDILLVDKDLSVGNINMSGNSILFVYNISRTVLLTMTGSLHLRDNATLVLNHSKLLVNQLYDQQFMMDMHNTSHFYAMFSNVTTSGYQWPGALWDSSNMTVAGSEFCVNPSWFPVTLIQNASIYSAYSLFYSDIVHFDFDWVPLTSRIVLDHCAMFNIWLAVKTGATADMSLPNSFSPTPLNWKFPGTFSVTNIDYKVELNVSYPMIFSTFQYRDSSITIRDSPSFLGSFYVDTVTASFSGMKEQYFLDKTFAIPRFGLRLVNSTVYTWNFYAGSGNVVVNDSDVGEILTMGDSTAKFTNCKFNGKGGYVSSHDTSDLRIYDSTINPVVVSYQQTRMEIWNTTIDFFWPTRVLASGESTLKLVDPVLGSKVSLSVLESGWLETWYSINTTVRKDGGPLQNASIDVLWRPNGTLAASGVTGPGGNASFTLLERTMTPGVAKFSDNYTMIASRNTSVASKDIRMNKRQNMTIDLLDFVNGTFPASGARDVPLETDIRLNFSFTMKPDVPPPFLLLQPQFPFSSSWDGPRRSLTIHPTADLLPATTYKVTVTSGAETASGIKLPEDFSISFSTTAVPPGPPLNLSIVAGNARATLRWERPSDDGGSMIEGYTVRRGTSPSGLAVISSLNKTEYTDLNLTNGVKYYYAISARNSAGEGNLSAVVSALPGAPPSQPRSPKAVAGDGYIVLSWDPPIDDGGAEIRNYSIYRGLTPGNLVKVATIGNATSFNDSGLTNDLVYYYQLTVTNSWGEGPLSVELNATPFHPKWLPGKVMNLTARSSDRKVQLNWSAPSDRGEPPLSGFNVYRMNGTTGWALLRTTTEESLVDNNVKNGLVYTYRISATSSLGEGLPSNEASATPWTTPSAPRNLTIIEENGRFLLSWKAPADDGGFAILEYRIYRSKSNTTGAMLATVKGQNHTDIDIQPSQGYYYQISAVTAKGEGKLTPTYHLLAKAHKKPGKEPGWMLPLIIGVIALLIALPISIMVWLKHRKRKDADPPTKG